VLISPHQQPSTGRDGGTDMFLVVCGSVELKRFWTKAEADAFCLSWTKYGSNARVVAVS